MARTPKNEGAEDRAQLAWCEEQAQKITGEITRFLQSGEEFDPAAAAQRVTDHLQWFLEPPVSDKNKDEVLRLIQNWIIRERRNIAKKGQEN